MVLLSEEQPKFGPLPAVASDYGFFECVVVSREGLVAMETNRYSVPAHLMGRVLTARIHTSRIEVFADQERVATHGRLPAGHTVLEGRCADGDFGAADAGDRGEDRDDHCTMKPVFGRARVESDSVRCLVREFL